ncbi:unnamed protein product, partial [Ectocarpus sp. 13 AM-2016]
LITELAVGIARRLSVILAGPEADRPEPGYFWHFYTSDFERGCDVLWRLGVARAAYGNDPQLRNLTCNEAAGEKSFPPYFRFFSADDIRAALAQEPPEASPELEEVLAAYVGVSCDYGPEDSTLSSKRLPFWPKTQYRAELEALERLGYVKTCGSEMAWTDKMAPTMQATYRWQDGGQSREEAEEEALAEECVAVLAATPRFTRWRLRRAAQRHSELAFATILRDRYDG